MRKYFLEIIVFITGASVMVLELVGSRVLAPYAGTSIYIWTILIGVILGSLSFGYWYGGKFADRNPNYKTFSRIIFIAGLFIGAMAFVKTIILMALTGYTAMDIIFGAAIGVVILFVPPSVLLGMVSPYAVRLKMKTVEKSGSTVGNLYAVSTIGSIVGTFVAGFFLISFLGNTIILLSLSILLILTSIFSHTTGKKWGKIGLIVFFIFGIAGTLMIKDFSKANGFVDVDTQYNRIMIMDEIDETTGRPIRSFYTDFYGRQSGMFLDGEELLVEYTRHYHLVDHFNPGFKKSLMIGGAGYSFPKDYLLKYPDAEIDVVEIDPKVTELAREYFDLPDDPRLNIIHADGRTYLNQTDTKYDAIFIDAFNPTGFVPHHITTKETIEKLRGALNDNGIVIMNMVTAIRGEGSGFMSAEYKTYCEVFPQVNIYQVAPDQDLEEPQNVILVALKSESPFPLTSLDGFLSRLLQNQITEYDIMDVPVLTDDFAPVDYYILRSIQ